MIIGIGSDLCDITRIHNSVARFGERFLNRIFTAGERAKAARRHDPGPTLAKRWAAKEACAKALGTGIHQGVFFRDMEVINLPSGQPTLRLAGGALLRLNHLVPAGYSPYIHLSLTDDHPWAQAFVVIEARPLS